MFFTVTVDTEEEWDWSAGWPTTDLSVTNVRQLPRFQEICSRYGVATTYFTDLAVLDDPEAREVVLNLARRPRVEIGMHIHPWNTPPLENNGPITARSTFLHNLPPGQIRAKLDTVYERFRELGLQPTSFRGGRYSTGAVVQDWLRERGFWADASCLPYTTWPDDGAPDHRQRDLCSRRLPPCRHGDQPLWEIPLTLGFTRRPFPFWRKFYEHVEHSWLAKLHVIGIVERLGLVRKVWLNFESPLGANMIPFLRKLARLDLPSVCFTVHSSSLVAGKGPYTRTQADEHRLFDQLADVFGTLAGWSDFRSATVSEVAQHLEREYACSRN